MFSTLSYNVHKINIQTELPFLFNPVPLQITGRRVTFSIISKLRNWQEPQLCMDITMLSHSITIQYFIIVYVYGAYNSYSRPPMRGSELPFVIIFDNSSTKGKNWLMSHTLGRPKSPCYPQIWGKTFRQPQLCYRTLPPATAGEFNSFPCKHGPLPITRKVAHRRKNVRCVTHDFYRAELKVSEFATVLWIYT